MGAGSGGNRESHKEDRVGQLQTLPGPTERDSKTTLASSVGEG